jgi:hypothetical protein
MSTKKLGIVGFPSLYGGAGVELDNQMTLWYEMGIEMHLIPPYNPSNEALLNTTLFRSKIHEPGEYSKLKGMPVISFCNDVYLKDIEKIKKYASRTLWVNCMSWLFPAEKEAHKKGLIDLFLYQTSHTQQKVGGELKKINKNYNWVVFNTWFDGEKFPYYKDRSIDKFRFGRISREDADKYGGETLWIYETMVSPVGKSGIILGFDEKSQKKIGTPPSWVRTYPACGITQQEFYAHSSCIIQQEDAYENCPRVAFEAMASGSLLIVDDKGGWKKFIKHGETGWLCKRGRDFVYYGSRMAYEPQERERMAKKALEYLHDEVNNKEKSKKDWEKIIRGA